ncbi:MAG: isoprenylcysteine carboxylmethyltransferase family protein [Eubacterium sp.]|nr:isoprenylcysteine carboxylmethyltransferase family protein [Eubacterium sp.]
MEKNSMETKLKNVMATDRKYEDIDDDLEQELEDEFSKNKVVKVAAKPLPTYGAGPFFGVVAVALTVLGVIFGHTEALENGISETFRIPYIVLGAILIFAAALIWTRAVFDTNIDSYIDSGRLCTTGIYAFTRNPIYAAILFACTGVLFISGNVYMYALPIIFWLFLTVLLQNTEEKWLTERFGNEYKEYMQRVNRVIPFKK